METTVEKVEEKTSKKTFKKILKIAAITTAAVGIFFAGKRYGSNPAKIKEDFSALGSKIMPKRKTEPVVEQPVERPQQYGQNGNGNRFQNNNGRFNSNSNNN